MVGGDEASERRGTRVNGAGGVPGDHEAVVDVGVGDAEAEGGVCCDGGVGVGPGGWDAGGVDGEEEVCVESDGGVCDCGIAGEVEVAGRAG